MLAMHNDSLTVNVMTIPEREGQKPVKYLHQKNFAVLELAVHTIMLQSQFQKSRQKVLKK